MLQRCEARSVKTAEGIGSLDVVPALSANDEQLETEAVLGGHVMGLLTCAQPTRAGAFIDLAVTRLADNPLWVLSARELAAAEAKGRKALRRPPRAARPSGRSATG